jgi:small subunit ribosomal protein S6e
MKINISDQKEGKSYNIEIQEEKEGYIVGKTIGDTLNGNELGFAGYEFKITGGSDKQGFPMRPRLPGTARRRMVISGGQGFKPKRNGQRAKKSVRGNIISNQTAQVNCVIVKHGTKPLVEEKQEATPEEKQE